MGINRVILFHFHLFKNAGTAIDYILEENFKERFVRREFKFWPYYKNIQEVVNWIKEEDAIAFSSHTARLFDPIILEEDGIKMIPIVFIRHPLIRIHSAYHFERKQKDIFRPGPVIARNTDLKGYIEIRWSIPRQEFNCKNFHVFRLADVLHNEEGEMFSKALKAIQKLPFVGLVEEFEKSIRKLEILVKQYYPEFTAKVVKMNTQFDPDISIETRLKMIENEVGSEFYKKLVDANKEDILLWEKVAKMYGR